MIYLISDGRACGLASLAEVRTAYATLEDAHAQAVQDQSVGRTPLRIEDDETREVVWRAEP